MEKDEVLEDLLTTTFEVDPIKADKAAKNLTLAQFESNFIRLESIIGFDGTAQVTKLGDFLDYRNGMFETYLQLSMNVKSKMDTSLPIPYEIFYSIESLKRYLGINEKKRLTDQSKLNISKYRLLHRDNPKSMDYLNSLIEKGEVSVERHEHWNKSPKDSSLRGSNILKKISYELTVIFNDLGLGKPK